MITLLFGLAWGGTLSGTVTGAPDGLPIDDVIVVAWSLRLDYEATITTLDGSWELTDLPAGLWRVEAIPADAVNRVPRFYPDARSYCDGELIALEADGERLGLNMALPLGAQITGRLLTVDGAPVANANVTADGADPEIDGLSREATTDADGAFTINGLDGDAGEAYAWRCKVDVDDVPVQYLGPTYDDEAAELVYTAPGELTEVGDRTLLAGITVQGTATGPDGPVADAYVHVYSSSQVVTVTTDADGDYTATGLPPGDVLAWLSADGLTTTYYPDQDRPGESVSAPDEGGTVTHVDLTALTEAVFRINLTPASEGEDLSGVTALLYNSTQTVGFGARAEEDGTVAIDGLYGGDYTLYLWAADEGYADGFLTDDAGEPLVYTVLGETDNPAVDVVLPQRARVAGEVVDEDGQPIEGAAIYAHPVDETVSTHAESSDASGVYELHGLDAGEWRLEARYNPYCSADPGYVTVWWPDDTLDEARAGVLSLVDTDALTDVVFVLPRDNDHDAMGDTWEASFGLDTTLDDGAEDPDGDGFSNLEEYLLGTDPVSDEGDGGCGCGGGKEGVAGLLLGLAWLRRRRR